MYGDEKVNLKGDKSKDEWFEGIQHLIDMILVSVGLPPQNEAQTVKTATEIVAK